jgi:murein DD-endopeptidase MepM/ murein hydrolase activator NlpD
VLLVLLVGAACSSTNSESAAHNKGDRAINQQDGLPPPAVNLYTIVQVSPTPGITPTITPPATTTPNTEAASTTTPITPVSDPEVLATVLKGEHYWLGRPFTTNSGARDLIESAYPYGTTALGLQPHHGVDIPNEFGTVVRAVSSGTVFYAGDDLHDIVFGPTTNFYGNVIVLEHQFEIPNSNGVVFTLYTLYGHLSQLYVRTGESVVQFQEIGAVGQAGVAIGPHLHLEVRIGDPYDYNATYNPNLWMQPYPGYGVLAGRVLLNGEPALDIEIEMISQQTRRSFHTRTYHYDKVNSDPWFRENFVMPDLREGRYDVLVSYLGHIAYQTIVDVRPEQTVIIQATIQ